MEKILYLGMGDDIITPLLLYPNFDKLYIIDFAYDDDIKSLIDRIRKTLIKGRTFAKSYRNCDCQDDKYNIPVKLADKAKIITERITASRWILKFKFDGKIRKIIRYERNYYYRWPKHMNNINHIISVNSAEWDSLLYDEFIPGKKDLAKKYRTTELRKSVMNAVNIPFTWTTDGMWNPYFPEKLAIFNGRGIHMLVYRNQDYDKDDPHSDMEYFPDIIGMEYLCRVRISSIEGNWYQKYSCMARDKKQY